MLGGRLSSVGQSYLGHTKTTPGPRPTKIPNKTAPQARRRPARAAPPGFFRVPHLRSWPPPQRPSPSSPLPVTLVLALASYPSPPRVIIFLCLRFIISGCVVFVCNVLSFFFSLAIADRKNGSDMSPEEGDLSECSAIVPLPHHRRAAAVSPLSKVRIRL